MTTDELFELHRTIAEGINTLRSRVDTGSGDPSVNHARVLFCALGASLMTQGLLDDLATFGSHMISGGSGLLYDDREVQAGFTSYESS